MDTPNSYPLEQMISIKKNRFDQAIKTLEEKKNLLEAAYEKLYDLTEEKNKIAAHKEDKLTQLRAETDAGTTSPKIQQAKIYLKIVEEKLILQTKKVSDQQKQVDLAQKQVDLATDDLFQKKKDLEKLELHKKDWEKENKVIEQKKESLEHDEQGSQSFSLRKREQHLRKKNEEKK